MWASTTHAQYSRKAASYGNDLTDPEWTILRPCPRLSGVGAKHARPMPMREVAGAICYVPWRHSVALTPSRLGGGGYRCFARLHDDGTLELPVRRDRRTGPHQPVWRRTGPHRAFASDPQHQRVGAASVGMNGQATRHGADACRCGPQSGGVRHRIWADGSEFRWSKPAAAVRLSAHDEKRSSFRLTNEPVSGAFRRMEGRFRIAPSLVERRAMEGSGEPCALLHVMEHVCRLAVGRRALALLASSGTLQDAVNRRLVLPGGQLDRVGGTRVGDFDHEGSPRPCSAALVRNTNENVQPSFAGLSDRL